MEPLARESRPRQLRPDSVARMTRKVRLQVALDFVDNSRALKCAREAVEGGADIVEVGTPLLKAEGLDAVRMLHKEPLPFMACGLSIILLRGRNTVIRRRSLTTPG